MGQLLHLLADTALPKDPETDSKAVDVDEAHDVPPSPRVASTVPPSPRMALTVPPFSLMTMESSDDLGVAMATRIHAQMSQDEDEAPVEAPVVLETVTESEVPPSSGALRALKTKLRFKRSRPFLNSDGSEQRQITVAKMESARQLIHQSVPDRALVALDILNSWVCDTYVPGHGEVIPDEKVFEYRGQMCGLQDLDDIMAEISFEMRRRANALANRLAARDNLRDCERVVPSVNQNNEEQ